jgi:transcriptional regulator with GAF, ATPase, and Fis domain
MKVTRDLPDLLNDTYNLIQLARETAKAKGNHAQAERLSPLVENLQTIVSESREPKRLAPAPGMMAQDDFRTLLAAAQAQPTNRVEASSQGERNQVIAAMAAGGMNELDIARQMGMTRDEVQLILRMGKK